MPETFTKQEGEWTCGMGEWGCYLRLYGSMNPDLDSVYHPRTHGLGTESANKKS